MECFSGALKGMGRSISSMVISIFGSCILRILWIYTVCPFFPNDIWVLYLAYPVTWIITGLGLAIFLLIAYKQTIKKRNAAQLQALEI
jgi:Na+-driven multidrug efflux pump